MGAALATADSVEQAQEMANKCAEAVDVDL
jgi:formate-dependent phosphoribosylglycinamide formyltransferase (GAR transformylase)